MDNLVRHPIALSAGGSRGAGICCHGDTRALETWSRSDGRWSVRRRPSGARAGDSIVPGDDGTVWLGRHRTDGWALGCSAPSGPETWLRVAAERAGPLACLPSDRAGPPAVLVGLVTGGRTHLAVLRARGPARLCLSPPVAMVDGRVTGAVWLDAAGTSLAVNTSLGGAPHVVRVVHLPDGDVSEAFAVRASSDDRVYAASPATGLIAVTTNAGGPVRVGTGRAGRLASFHFPEPLVDPGGHSRPLSFDPTGTRLLVHHQAGARSLLRCYDLVDGEVRGVALPDGSCYGDARWTADTCTVVWSAPGVPATPVDVDMAETFPVDVDVTEAALVDVDTAEAALVDVDTAEAALVDVDATEAIPVRVAVAPVGGARAYPPAAAVERVAGAAGDIEVVRFGPTPGAGADVLLALHGGPLDLWRYSHEPLWEEAGRRRWTVLALNQRGSLGYGQEHAGAIFGSWGGHDLADVVTVLAGVWRGGARRIVLAGDSYGAWLALLAAGTEPGVVDGVVALAPFASVRALHDAAGTEVRGLVERLGGVTTSPAGRDVLSRRDRLVMPVLILHGAADAVVPPRLSARLAAALPAARRYELPGVGHDLPCSACARSYVLEFLERLPARSSRTAAGRPAGGRHNPDERKEEAWTW